MKNRNLSAEFDALETLARVGELDLLLLSHYRWLYEAVLSTNRRVLDWHNVNGDGQSAWCWTCKALKERGHKC